MYLHDFRAGSFIMIWASLSWSWSYGSWIYNYLCNLSLSPQKLWVRILIITKCIRYNVMWYILSVTSDWSVVFSGYSDFLHQLHWPPRYNWRGVIHHSSNPLMMCGINVRFGCNEWLLFNAKWVIIQLYHGERKAHFSEMMKMLDLYLASMLSWIIWW